MLATLKSITIDDDLATVDTGAIEVTLTFSDGSKRWCFFMTPQTLAAVGDFVPGTQVRVHYGAPHMVVVSEISADIIEKTIRLLEAEIELESCTRPLGTTA